MKHTLALLFSLAVTSSALAADLDKPIPAPSSDPVNAAASEIAVLAGGCFWGQQGVFQHVKGVTKVVAGYSGGAAGTATYDQVTTETTGHAESVQITFNPKIVSYGRLLQIFFSVSHDPTEVNRQGPDTGTQYRGVIFYADPGQQKIANDYIAQLDAAHAFAAPIVTQVTPFKAFYPAEDYHQDYARLHPDALYIAINDAPKVIALQRELPTLYRAQPVTWHAGHPATIMVDLH